MTAHALVVGEALVDEVRRPNGSEDAFVGGSPANVAIGLARLGRSAELLTWIGRDDYGDRIRHRLAADGVAFVPGSDGASRTSVARAILDADGAASYDFSLEWVTASGAAPTERPTVFHTGSIATVLEPGATGVLAMAQAHRPHATVTYDPNARPSLMGSRATARAAIDRMVRLADVVKASDEDLEWLRPGRAVEAEAERWLAMGPALVVVTRGGEGATALSRGGLVLDVAAPRVEVADTVGAGDSFMAGLIDGLWGQGLLGAGQRDQLGAVSSETLEWIVRRCAAIAAITVSRPGADPPTRAELGEL